MSDGASGPERESEWIRRVADGDRGAFEELHRAFIRPVFGFVLRLLRDEARAEEIANDVLVEVWKGAGRYRGESRPSTWIFGIAHHKAMTELRRRRPADGDEDAMAGLANGREGPEAAAGAAERREGVRRALAHLSPEHRAVIELTFYRGCSYGEIAKIMRCPVNTVKTRMFYARKKLAALLKELGISWELA